MAESKPELPLCSLLFLSGNFRWAPQLRFLRTSKTRCSNYTTWKDRWLATPMYWFIIAPYKSPPFGGLRHLLFRWYNKDFCFCSTGFIGFLTHQLLWCMQHRSDSHKKKGRNSKKKDHSRDIRRNFSHSWRQYLRKVPLQYTNIAIAEICRSSIGNYIKYIFKTSSIFQPSYVLKKPECCFFLRIPSKWMDFSGSCKGWDR